MRLRKFLVASLVSVLSFSSLSAVSAANPKAGNSCSSVGKKQVHAGKTFTCVKSGKKLVWSKGVTVIAAPKPKPTVNFSPSASPSPTPVATPSAAPTPIRTPTPSPTMAPIPTVDNYAFTNWCDPDPFVPEIWKKFQDTELSFNYCPPPYRYLVKNLPSAVPATEQTRNQDLTPIAECRNESTRIWKYEGLLGPKAKKQTVIQVVPFYMNDGVPTTTPKQDWQDALNFAVDAISKMSEGSVNLKIKIPDSYIYVNGDLKSYGLGKKVGHGDPAFANKRWELIEKIVPVVDPAIDFTEADMVWFLAPSNVKRTLLSNQIAHSRVIRTAEKSLSIYNSSYISSPISDFSKEGFQEREPFGFVHELMHIFDVLDDHYGDGKNNLGTGSWGNMSGAMFDFLAFDKWSLGWITDSQVRCAPKYATSIHWIKPSTIKGSSEKLLMVPLSKTKSIAVESIRNSGFNFKLPERMLGTLVYTVDTSILDDRNRHGEGLNVICPANRSCDLPGINPQSFKLSGAALKVGEFVQVEGYKISVVESGEFGDVVKVERTAPIPKPTSFDNLYENRAGISQAAWSKASETIKASKAKYGDLEIYTGPNTKPYFDDYPTAVSLVSRLFPSRSEPTKTIVIRFNYKDLGWAENITREKLNASDYDQIQRSENNQFVSGNCEAATSNCRGARQQTGNSGVSVIMQGVENQLDANDPTAKLRFYSGMLEAHEYFHALQRIPIMGKSNVWPHAWFREGSAEWVQNVTINHTDFNKYQEYLRLDCNPICLRLSEADIAEFLDKSNGESAGPKFDRWLNYSLGSHVIEVLVALKGPDTLIEMYAQMSTRINFAEAFKNIYGVEWSYVIPILAKTIHANLNGK